jgi:hypothetical protein
MSLDALASHVSTLEALVFKHKVIFPDPPFLQSDAIDPELIALAADPILAGRCGARRVPSDYYVRDSLEYRRDCIGAQSIDQLCKCVLFEIKDAPDPLKRFVCVVVQYIDRISQPKLLNVCSQVVGGRVSDVSFAKDEEAVGLSGSVYNGITPVLLRPRPGYEKFQVALVLSKRIAGLDPRFFWLVGGEVDVKFGIETAAFVRRFKPLIVDISA